MLRSCEPWLFLPFRVSVSLDPSVISVSSPRPFARSVRISRTTRSCSLRAKGYETYRAGNAFARGV